MSAANVRLAVDLAKKFSAEGKSVSIMMPDEEVRFFPSSWGVTQDVLVTADRPRNFPLNSQRTQLSIKFPTKAFMARYDSSRVVRVSVELTIQQSSPHLFVAGASSGSRAAGHGHSFPKRDAAISNRQAS